MRGVTLKRLNLAKYKMFCIYTFLDFLTVCICMWCIHACICGVYMCDVSMLVCVLCVRRVSMSEGKWLFVVSDSVELYVFSFFCAADKQQL